MFDRRKFVKAIGLGGLFGGPAAIAEGRPAFKTGVEGILVLYISVGFLSPEKTEACSWSE